MQKLEQAANEQATDLQTIARCKQAIEYKKKIEQIQKQLDPIAAILKEQFGADGKTFAVPGYGKVMVKRGSPGKSDTVMVTNRGAFEALDEETQKMLLERGVVAYDLKTTSARSASVTITPNA